MAQSTPRKPYSNCNATEEKLGNSTEKQLGMSVSCELSFRPVVQMTTEKKYFEERNILFVQLIEEKLRLYDKCSSDYSRRHKTGLAWCRTA
jgi:hypothetical protein